MGVVQSAATNMFAMHGCAGLAPEALQHAATDLYAHMFMDTCVCMMACVLCKSKSVLASSCRRPGGQ
eukprot:4775919-Alexandrium_andersonii.AAC.1